MIRRSYHWLGGDSTSARAAVRFSELAALILVIIGVAVFIQDLSERTKERHYAAWQVINSAQGKGGSGGRVDALQDLNDGGVSLDGVDVDGAWLQDLRLPKARMSGFSAREASLYGADLSGANLYAADLRANLYAADLSGAHLERADFACADLRMADLRGATGLTQGQLEEADGDESTRLPQGLERPGAWTRGKDEPVPPPPV